MLSITQQKTYENKGPGKGTARLSLCLAKVCAVLQATAFVIFGSGCAQTVQVTHSDAAPLTKTSDFFNTAVVVQSPVIKDSDIHSHGAFFAVGILNNWDIDVATTLPDAVAEALSYSFARVTVEDHYSRGCDGCGLIVRPRLVNFGVNKVTMRASIDIQLRVYDAHENLITTFEHRGKSPFMSLSRLGVIGTSLQVPLVTSLFGKPVMNATAQSALDDALENIKTTFQTETQQGGELAKVWRPKKQSYGEQEFAAEKLAKKLGCNMRTDGLHLVQSKYGKEEYDAYCWSVGVFSISCELGRCQRTSDKAIAYQSEQSDLP